MEQNKLTNSYLGFVMPSQSFLPRSLLITLIAITVTAGVPILFYFNPNGWMMTCVHRSRAAVKDSDSYTTPNDFRSLWNQFSDVTTSLLMIVFAFPHCRVKKTDAGFEWGLLFKNQTFLPIASDGDYFCICSIVCPRPHAVWCTSCELPILVCKRICKRKTLLISSRISRSAGVSWFTWSLGVRII